MSHKGVFVWVLVEAFELEGPRSHPTPKDVLVFHNQQDAGKTVQDWIDERKGSLLAHGGDTGWTHEGTNGQGRIVRLWTGSAIEVWRWSLREQPVM